MTDIENLRIKITNGLNTKKHPDLEKKILLIFSKLEDLINKKIDNEEKAELIINLGKLSTWIKQYFDVTKTMKTNINYLTIEGEMNSKNIEENISQFHNLREYILKLISIKDDADKSKKDKINELVNSLGIENEKDRIN